MAIWPQWELARDWLLTLEADGGGGGGGGGLRPPDQSWCGGE
jgi:hypothetical protein